MSIFFLYLVKKGGSLLNKKVQQKIPESSPESTGAAYGGKRLLRTGSGWLIVSGREE